MTKSKGKGKPRVVRDGDWIQVYLGDAFYVFDARPEEVNLEDVVHSLSLQCRFGGHCIKHYSVAEHSVRVMQCFMKRHPNAHPKLALGALLHDAAEAYLVDLPRPVKKDPRMSAYSEIEAALQAVIAKRFELEAWMLESMAVKIADSILLATEKRDVMLPSKLDWHLPDPLRAKIRPWSAKKAKREFMREFNRLVGMISERDSQETVVAVA